MNFRKGILVCLEKYDDSTPINIGSGSEISIKDLAILIAEQIGFSGEIIWDLSRPDGTFRKILDISKISKLGLEPTIDLKDGIRMTIEWFLQNKKELVIRV